MRGAGLLHVKQRNGWLPSRPTYLIALPFCLAGLSIVNCVLFFGVATPDALNASLSVRKATAAVSEALGTITMHACVMLNAELDCHLNLTHSRFPLSRTIPPRSQSGFMFSTYTHTNQEDS